MAHRMASVVLMILMAVPRPAFAIEPVRQTTRSANASSPDELEKELGLVAEQLSKFLKGSNEDTLSVGEFTGPPQLSSHAGPGIAQMLNKALERLSIRCLPRAKLGLQGKYVLDETKATIRGELVDLSGKTLFTFTRDFANPASFATLFGPTGKVDVDNTQDASVLHNVVLNPQTTLNGPRVFASPNSPYGIEICVKSGDEYLPRPAQDVNGLAFLKIARGESYAIKLVNNSPHDAAVRLSIDGISVFAFSENPNYKHFIVRAKAKKLITGWHRTNEVSDEFLVTSYSKSAAAEVLPSSPSIGTITATFMPAWAEGDERLDQAPPEITAPSNAPLEFDNEPTLGSAQPGSPSPDAPADEPDATGRGQQIQKKYNELRRFVGPVKAIVTVRYTKQSAPTNDDGGNGPLLFTDAGDWLEVRARSAPVKLGSRNLLMLSAGDIVHRAGQQGDWYYVSANKPDGTVVNGFVYSGQASEYEIPFTNE